MDLFDILTMIGGLSLFLFGMNIMGEAIRSAKLDFAAFGDLYAAYAAKYRLA